MHYLVIAILIVLALTLPGRASLNESQVASLQVEAANSNLSTSIR